MNINMYSIISKIARYLAFIGIIKYNKNTESGNVSAYAIKIENVKYVGSIITVDLVIKYTIIPPIK